MRSDIDILVTVSRAVMELNGQTTRSVGEVAKTVSKASRFLWPNRGYQLSYEEVNDRENKALLEIVSGVGAV